MRHSIISGTVTNRRDHVPARRIVKRAVIVVAVLFAAMLALGFTLNAMGYGPKEIVPACELEDGSTQEICEWFDEYGWRYVNHDFGRWYEVHPVEEK